MKQLKCFSILLCIPFVVGKFINNLEKCKLGIIQTLEWESSEIPGEKFSKGESKDKSITVEILKELKAMDWQCPVKIIGPSLKKTLVFILITFCFSFCFSSFSSDYLCLCVYITT